ncbi:DMT family transporter [Acuticoccus kandeliae]|uniref:DMT family transporter n=1 Tax=Acuticoccus kandeliae TaxID=2073160 RepID=UPI000D3E53D8|nr:multidrug efflux SMR transporter [Acuticoccus kandeliae]
MPWAYLLLAGFLEIGWPLGLKIAQSPGARWSGALIAVAFMAASGAMLFLAQRHIPMGTAYAVWTGVGAAGTFLVGILAFGDAASAGRIMGVAMIIGGVIVLKLASH